MVSKDRDLPLGSAEPGFDSRHHRYYGRYLLSAISCAHPLYYERVVSPQIYGSESRWVHRRGVTLAPVMEVHLYGVHSTPSLTTHLRSVSNEWPDRLKQPTGIEPIRPAPKGCLGCTAGFGRFPPNL
jgi:hypothetical protein